MAMLNNQRVKRMWMLWTSKDEAMRSYRYGWECWFLKACSRAPYLLDPARHGQTQKNTEKFTWIIHFHKLWAAKLCKSLSAHEASVSFSENPTIQSRRKASLKYLDMNLESAFFIFQMHPATHLQEKDISPTESIQRSQRLFFDLGIQLPNRALDLRNDSLGQCVDVTHLAAVTPSPVDIEIQIPAIETWSLVECTESIWSLQSFLST